MKIWILAILVVLFTPYLSLARCGQIDGILLELSQFYEKQGYRCTLEEKSGSREQRFKCKKKQKGSISKRTITGTQLKVTSTDPGPCYSYTEAKVVSGG